jgi:hypothetical protein
MSTNYTNILHLIGNKDEIINFLYNFYDGNYICKMDNILPICDYDYKLNEHQKIDNWGLNKDISDSDNLRTVLSNNKKINKRYHLYTIEYTTIDYNNYNFIFNVSKMYPKIKFIYFFFNNKKYNAGKCTIKNGTVKDIKNIEINNIKNDKEFIYYYDFLLNEKLIKILDLGSILRLKSNFVKNYFLNKINNMITVYDFEDLEREYSINNIVKPIFKGE